MNPVLLLGLACDLVGSLFVVKGLVISRREAIELGVSRVSGNTDQENLQLPQVKDRLKQSRNAKIGSVFLLVGFVLNSTRVCVPLGRRRTVYLA